MPPEITIPSFVLETMRDREMERAKSYEMKALVQNKYVAIIARTEYKENLNQFKDLILTSQNMSISTS